MGIYVPRTSLPQQPAQPSAVPASGVVPVQQIGNQAGAVVPLAQQVSAMAAQILRDDRDKEIVARLNEVDVERRRSDAAIVSAYGDLRGKEAVDKRGDVLQQLEQNAKRVRAGIKDPEVARLWKGQDEQLLMASSLSADRHYREQRAAWEVDTLGERADQLVVSLKTAALGDGYNPATGQLSDEARRVRSAMHSTIGELGGRLGWSDEHVANERRKADTSAFSSVVEDLVSQRRATEAARVLEAVASHIEPDSLRRLKATVQRADLDEEGRRLAGRALELAHQTHLKTTTIGVGAAQFEVPVATRPDYDRMKGDAIAAVDQLAQSGQISGALADNVTERIEKIATRQKGLQMAEDSKLLDDVEATLIANPLVSWRDLPASVQQQLADAGKLDAIVEFADSGRRYSTTPMVEAGLGARSDADWATTDPVAFKVQMRGALSNERMNYWLGRIDKAKGEASEPARITTIAEAKRRAAVAMGILPSNRTASKTEEAAYDVWQADFDARVLLPWQQDNKRKAGPEDVRRLLELEAASQVQRRVTGDGIIGKTWHSIRDSIVGPDIESTALGLVPAGEAGKAFVELDGTTTKLGDVPPAEWKRIAAFLERKGDVQPTPANVIDFWRSIGSPGAPPLSPQEIARRDQAKLDELFQWFNSPGAGHQPAPPGSLELLRKKLQQPQGGR